MIPKTLIVPRAVTDVPETIGTTRRSGIAWKPRKVAVFTVVAGAKALRIRGIRDSVLIVVEAIAALEDLAGARRDRTATIPSIRAESSVRRLAHQLGGRVGARQRAEQHEREPGESLNAAKPRDDSVLRSGSVLSDSGASSPRGESVLVWDPFRAWPLRRRPFRPQASLRFPWPPLRSPPEPTWSHPLPERILPKASWLRQSALAWAFRQVHVEPRPGRDRLVPQKAPFARSPGRH